MTFYTPQDAMNWLQGQVANLFAARGVLQDAYGRAVLVQQKALAVGIDPMLAPKATQLVADLTTSLEDQTSLENKVRSVVPDSWLPQTMGLVPLIIGVGVIAIAGAVYLHLQQVAQHQQTLALVEKGVLTPEQAVALESSGGILGSTGLSGITDNLKYILMAGAGLYALTLFGPALSRMFGGRKA